MGVVYKLKQEIYDFIILKKKEDPSLSCRKLVDIIEQTFRIQVSKSSVNAIIKEQALSNPVGRSAIFKAPKNFFIPQEKKDLLRANVVPFLKKDPVSASDNEYSDPLAFVIEKKAPQESIAVEYKRDMAEEPVLSVKLPEDILANPVEKIRTPFEHIWEDKGPLYKDAGTIFLRAPLWEVSREPVLGGLLKEWAGEGSVYKGIPGQWEEMLFMAEEPLLRVDLIEKNITDERVFFLQEITAGDPLEMFRKKKLIASEEMALESAVKSLTATAGAVRLVTRNGKTFRLHPGLREVYIADEKENIASEPLYKTMEMVADRLINNVKPLVSTFPLGHFFGEALFLGLTDALEGREDAIARIEVVGEDNKVLGVFEGFSAERRGYIFLTDVKEIFGEKRGGILDQQQTVVDPVSDEEVGIGFGTVLVGEKIFAVVKERKEDGTSPRTFISNVLEEQEKRDAILYEAAGFSSYGQRQGAFPVIKPVVFDGLVGLESRGVMGTFTEFLFWLAETRYFDTKEALEAAGALSGYIKQDNDRLYIKFLLTPGMPFEQEIREAAQRVNENVIFDRVGRRVLLSFA